eukprot:CAMPEP_0174244768 /NCGR_PEP_ID=MMETSP0417-20130205/36555_1 /TAXON_ID=242541 /ORGANISM="Mayorella sp, Strain BSH-02190019" /LENGTH=51 /DNA_ID=CAMNT_0015324491 /DNA_START=1 /DNA_END=152 /DNA_ORIENTATION=-
MCNYSGVVLIVGVLNLSYISRLKQSWKYVSPKSTALLEKLQESVQQQSNFA